LGVPVYELLGGKIRDKLPVYWSHFVTTRVRSAVQAGVAPVKTLDDVRAMGREARERGFRAVKTNPVFFGGEPRVYMPGFGRSAGGPELNHDRTLIRGIEEYLTALREGLGDEIGIMLDLNFNFKTDGFRAIARAVEPFRLTWLELDSYDPAALRMVRDVSRTPICSGENLYGVRDFRPYFEHHAMDVASVDLVWNGLLQGKKIADMAELYEMNVAPHNHYSHLAELMASHFCAAIPNFKILEVDVDDVPWKGELVTAKPRIEQGELLVPDRPGWGAEINEAILKAHPWPKPQTA
jgi:L-alanine-DL-glutamate epimerase-like enolase superfamily enzyme